MAYQYFPLGLADVETSFEFSSHEKKLLFSNLTKAVWGILIFYSTFYYHFNVWLAFSAVSLGAVLFSPLTLYLEKKNYSNIARFFFICSCNFYIFFCSLGLNHQINAEYYFLPASMIPLLVFDRTEKKKIAVGIFLPLVVWLLTFFPSIDFFPSYLLATNAPYEEMRTVNFVGAFIISLVFISIFVNSIVRLQNILYLQNIDKREKLIEQIKKDEELKLILTYTKVGIWKYDLLTRSVQWDDSMFKLFSIDRSSFLSAWARRVCPNDRARVWQDFKEALKGEREFETTFKMVDGKGAPRYIAARGVSERNAEGKVVAMRGVSWERTNEVELERTLAEQERFLNVVLNNIPSMIFVKDFRKDLSFSLLNKAGEKLLGVRSQDFIGKNDYDFFSKEQADFFVSKDKAVFESGLPLKIEQEEINTPKGKRILRTQKVPTFDEQGHRQFLVGISNDITEEIESQKVIAVERAKSLQSAKLATLGEMAAGIAHEVNNPLAIIEGATRLLMRSLDDRLKTQERIEVILKATHRISRIVTGLRRFSRTNKNTERRSHLLGPLLNEVVTLVHSKAVRNNVRVDLNIESNMPVLCDEVEIEQVFINLVNNAIDAAKLKTDKWVHVRVFDQDKQVLVHVTDSGDGIPNEIREKIFNPFFTTKEVGEGTGLGLSISKGIVESHNGSLEALENTQHTCFEVKLPRHQSIRAENVA